MAAITRLAPDGYGARRAGSFAGKSVVIIAPGLVTPSDALAAGLTATNARRGGLSVSNSGAGGLTVNDGPRIEDL